ncbi:uncharacterized protein MELLADRAFT_112193 [Melampsora larici-populina 98AG31]|uniref:Uncharacterized protein n=1 Tax=Melampsora larici-populina (strain 98AG31 / pathotype 3-4-7) TaxID=747676 RepID=F4S5N7_MELLP|nr:uncharacterized protein MELLADRAFT_112193 [Melampsora larici-populina 98AG31]EGG00078.1 hypothetical protein MELLADRAFT_112193 [Melampsora larici-populina 98AG31]
MESSTKPESSHQVQQANSINQSKHHHPSSTTNSELESNHSINTPIPSLTLSLFQHLFDDRLTWQRKIGCMTATLAINLFLPFVNGIMLGFGEIAARELVGKYFGWGIGPFKESYRTNSQTQLTKEDELILIEPSLQISTDQSRWWKPSNQTKIDQR